ncbi:peptidase M48 Ste24p [Alicycliphilus sp. B1]|nr:peptidase M48 Ste24p [Alicycliphilus sp. B1]
MLQEYVQDLFQALVQAARERGELSPELQERFAWQILLGRDRTVNAFALPGGYFGVHLGLIGVVSTRDELASVLAHELSHVTQRHIARLMAQQGRQTPLMLGAMILGALAAAKNPAAAQAMMVGGQALAVQNQLNFSRDMEREADRVGFGLMQPAGFAPQGFVGMFDKLQQANRINDNGSWPYLRSHPLTTQRIADMHSRVPQGAAAPAPATLAAPDDGRARARADAPRCGHLGASGWPSRRTRASLRVPSRSACRPGMRPRSPPCSWATWRPRASACAACRRTCAVTRPRRARHGCWARSWNWPRATRRRP